MGRWCSSFLLVTVALAHALYAFPRKYVPRQGIMRLIYKRQIRTTLRHADGVVLKDKQTVKPTCVDSKTIPKNVTAKVFT